MDGSLNYRSGKNWFLGTVVAMAGILPMLPTPASARSLPKVLQSGMSDLIHVEFWDRETVLSSGIPHASDDTKQSAGVAESEELAAFRKKESEEKDLNYRTLFKSKASAEDAEDTTADMKYLNVPEQISKRLVTVCLHLGKPSELRKAFDIQRSDDPRYIANSSQSSCAQVEPIRQTFYFWKESDSGKLIPALSSPFDLSGAEGGYVLLIWERD